MDRDQAGEINSELMIMLGCIRQIMNDEDCYLSAPAREFCHLALAAGVRLATAVQKMQHPERKVNQ